MIKSQLLPILRQAVKYAPKKDRWGETKIPILANARIMSNNGVLAVETTNLEKHFVGHIKGSDIPNTEFLIDVRWLKDIINVMDKKVDIEFEISYRWLSSNGHSKQELTSPVLIVKQNRTIFNLKVRMNLEDFPLHPVDNNLKYVEENIDGKNFTGILYTYDNEDEYQNPYKIHKDKRKELNKLLPKYLVINGAIAIKTGISYDLIPNNKPNSYDYKYYGNYDLSYGSNIQDDVRKISVNEIKNYEAVDTKKERK